MPRGDSGRIVIDLKPSVKKRIYTALGIRGQTLKDWFLEESSELLQSSVLRETPRGFGQTTLPLDDDKPASLGLKDVLNRSAAKKKFRVVSMFSGCGGMDLGFMGGFESLGRGYDPLPFEIVWANDLNEAACRSYRHNLGGEIRCGDVWSIMNTMPDSADILIGGFPCQDISINGKMAGVDGKRSGLYRAMVEAVDRLRPKMFVAENVRGLLLKANKQSLTRVIEDFKSLGYHVSYQLYNAADYGVAQKRERVFIVGAAPGVPAFIPPKPERDKHRWITARKALHDLESLDVNPDINHIWSAAGKSSEQGNRKLRGDQPAHTMRAECHGNIQFHYSLPRRISMREAARIQSFPDEFIFQSKLRETERQVGNAVPPVLAWHVANAVLRTLERNGAGRNGSNGSH